MLVNRSRKTSLDKSLQLLLVSVASVGLLSMAAASAQAPAVPTTPPTAAPPAAPAVAAPAAPAAPASTSAPAQPIAPAATPVTPAQVAPASSANDTSVPATPVQNPHPVNIKPNVNVYSGYNDSTLDFPNRNPALKKPGPPYLPWKMAVISENNPAYFVNVSYPQFDPVKGSDPSKLNEEVKRYVSAQIDVLRQSMPAKMAHIEGPKPLSYINGVCGISLYNQHLCSMTVDLTSYVFQSAHPIESLTTFNYRLDSNQQFPLTAVFRKEFKVIPNVSKICIGALSRGLDDEGVDWVRRGAAPDEKNFAKFQLTNQDLQIVFDPYTVDNGADGFKTVPIEWNRLRSDVSLELPFHGLVTR